MLYSGQVLAYPEKAAEWENILNYACDYNGPATIHTVAGKLHNVDGPAVIYDNCEMWYIEGKLHREDGPAVIYDDCKMWYVDGNLHRDNGPAIEYQNGTVIYALFNHVHRMGGPAIEIHTGTKLWCEFGKIHNINGPAIRYADGTEEWVSRGVVYKRRFNRAWLPYWFVVCNLEINRVPANMWHLVDDRRNRWNVQKIR